VSFLAELKRRKVFRVGVVYAATAFVIIQAADIMLPSLGVPAWALSLIVVMVILGFPVALVLGWALELTPDGIKRTESVPAAQTGHGPAPALLGKRTVLASALLVAVGVGIGAGWFLRPAAESSRESTPVASADPLAVVETPVTSPETQSIAVLAFADLSPDRDQEYFGDGIAEEILNALVRLPGLRVAGRTSAFYFKGRNEDLRTIGATLGVAHILEGSVRKQGERLRITAQLIRSEDGFHLWSATYDGTDADIFALQERIAREVTRELQVALGTGEDQRLVNAGTENPDAYALYLRATDIFNRRDAERYEEAIAATREALRLDSGYARAHSRLATLYFLWSAVAVPERYEALTTEAARQARSALELDPSLAEPHAVLAMLLQADRRYADSADAMQRALEIDPNDLTALFWRASNHCLVGTIELCERELDHVLMLDPLLPNALGWRARLYISAGDLATAERMIERSREAGLRWAGVSAGWIALERGDRATAQAQWEEVHRIFGAGLTPEAAMTLAAARAGDEQAQERSRAMIDDYLATSPARINGLVPLTLISIGDVERGLEVFAAHPTPNEALFLSEVMGTRWYPDAWTSPAFPAFLRKTGIAEYWDRFGAPERCRKDASGDYQCQ